METITLRLNGLSCANCAAKIEASAKKIEHVENAELNFATGSIKLSCTESAEEQHEIVKQLKRIVKRLEPSVKVEMDKDAYIHIHTEECSGHSHEHGHSHSHEGSSNLHKSVLVSSAMGIALFAGAITSGRLEMPLVSSVLFVIAYLFLGWDVIATAVRNIIAGNWFDENFLMSVATIGALCIGEFPEAVAVMLFYKVGEYLQAKAVGKSRKSIESLMSIKPEYANILVNGELKKVKPDDVAIGNIIIVLPGEKVPLDGVVTDGQSQLDTSSLTGEAALASVHAGDEILSGSINLSGKLSVRAAKDYSNSTVAKILELVENASAKKAPAEKIITRFARVYTPLVIALAVIVAVIPPLVLEGAEFSHWIRQALSFLVVSCPCALVISVPLSFFSGIGAASKNGILIKGGNYLQLLSKADTVVFDKTGTLTKGVFEVTELIPTEGVSEKELLLAAYTAEKYSNHPIAKSIVKKCMEDSIVPINEDFKAKIEEISGYGIKAEKNGNRILCGNARLMDKYGINYKLEGKTGSIVYVSEEQRYLGQIVISDKIKPDAKEAVALLMNDGINKIYMLTGDRKAAADSIAAELGINHVRSELLPNEKVEVLESIYIENPGAKVIFTGDGINDAPVLARSDIGFAMGAIGSDAAIEAADVVIINDEPSKIHDAIKISRFTMGIVRQNIILALAFKVIVLVLIVLGYSPMWLAVLADVGVCLLVVLNTLRIKP